MLPDGSLESVDELVIGAKYDLGYLCWAANMFVGCELVQFNRDTLRGVLRRPTGAEFGWSFHEFTWTNEGVRLHRTAPATPTHVTVDGSVAICPKHEWVISPGFLVNYENCGHCGIPREQLLTQHGEIQNDTTTTAE
jgi:hypothetical protein